MKEVTRFILIICLVILVILILIPFSILDILTIYLSGGIILNVNSDTPLKYFYILLFGSIFTAYTLSTVWWFVFKFRRISKIKEIPNVVFIGLISSIALPSSFLLIFFFFNHLIASALQSETLGYSSFMLTLFSGGGFFLIFGSGLLILISILFMLPFFKNKA